jgi:hypothetical protein
MAKKIYDIIPPKNSPASKETEDGRESVRFEKKKKKFKKSLLIIPLFLLIGGGVFGFFWFSEAELTLYPKTEKIEAQEKIILSSKTKDTDLEKGVIPAIALETAIDLEGEFQSTGKIKKETKAFGIITVYNEYSDTPRSLVSSRFVSADGKVFWSKSKVTIPGRKKEKNKIIPGQVDVKVEAAETGQDSNIGPTTFALPALAGSPLYTAIYAKSFSAMSGGNIGEAEEVTEADLNLAKNSLFQEAKEQNKKNLLKNLQSGMEILDQAITHDISKEESSLPAGTVSKSFKFKVSVTSKTMAFKTADIGQIIDKVIASNLKADEQIEEESLTVGYILQSDASDSEELLANIEADKFKKIDIESLKESLAGKSADEARLFLSGLSGISKIEFKLKPFFQTSFPANKAKIKVNFYTGK